MALRARHPRTLIIYPIGVATGQMSAGTTTAVTVQAVAGGPVLARLGALIGTVIAGVAAVTCAEMLGRTGTTTARHLNAALDR